MVTRDNKVTIDPTQHKLADRKRGVVAWLITPGLPPIFTLIMGIVFLTTTALLMSVWGKIIIAPVVAYFIFTLGRAYEQRNSKRS